MNKTAVMSLAAVVGLNASTVNEAFAEGKAFGEIRAAYISQINEASTDTYTTAIGGILKYETSPWNDTRLGIGGYVSQKLGFASGSGDKVNYDVLSSENGSYAYVGEAYIDYSAGDVSLRVGRQLLDTPYADTDDIRMHPNTFEAAIATYKGIEATTLLAGYVSRWAGYDSGDDISEFKKLGEGSDGAAVLGFANESIKNLLLQGWYYGVDKVADLYYADATYELFFNEETGVELNAQWARFNEKSGSGMDGSVYGVRAIANAGMFTVGAAYNRGSNDEGKSPPVGFGGGPYYTSMQELTIEGMEEVRAYQLSAQLDMAGAGIGGLTLMALYGSFKSAPADTRITETDVIAAYKISETAWADVSYAAIDDRNSNADDGTDAGYSRFLARLSYNF